MAVRPDSSQAMTLQLYDTLSGAKRVFEPADPERVTMYLCGPTVYNYAHIGNARPAVVFDVLQRLLRRDYPLVFARNITDIDDKINAAALESGQPIQSITSRFEAVYLDDMAALGVAPPDIAPHATETIAPMIAMIERLLERDHAYVAEGHVLFDVTSYDDYGALSRRELDAMIAGARVEVAPYKRSPADFVLWKPSTPELPGWDSPWGRGRPGWHLECSAMCLEHLGETIDIHCGGIDLVFPHHENEIAQSRCANGGRPLARYWLHNGFLNVDSTKMSKSLGNVLLIHDLVREHPGEVIRLALLSAHYRQPLDWTDSVVTDAARRLDHWYGALRGVDPEVETAGDTEPAPAVLAALHDDLNTPQALAELSTLARAVNRADAAGERERLARELKASAALLGLLSRSAEQWFEGATDAGDEAAIEALIAEREAARERRDFATADRLRDELKARGIELEDGAAGTRWRRRAAP